MQRRRPSRKSLSVKFAVLTAVAATALVAGCSDSKPAADATLPAGTELVTQSSATTKKLTSAHLDIKVDGTIDNLPVQTLSGDLTNVPAVAVQGHATITMMGQAADVDLIVVDGILFGSLTPGQWSDFGPAEEIYDPSTILNPDTGLANLLANISDAKSESSEKIDGTDTVKVSGKVSPEAANKLLPQLKATAPIPTDTWIERDGEHNLVRAELKPTDDTSLQITLSKWNAPVTVTKPQT